MKGYLTSMDGRADEKQTYIGYPNRRTNAAGQDVIEPQQPGHTPPHLDNALLGGTSRLETLCAAAAKAQPRTMAELDALLVKQGCTLAERMAVKIKLQQHGARL